MRPSGSLNPLTVLLFLGLAALGYFLFFFGPLYIDNLSVREAASAAFNAYQSDGPAKARITLLATLNGPAPGGPIGWHYEVDEDGEETVKPGLGVDPENVSIEYDASSRSLVVRVEYERTIQLKPTEKRHTKYFVVEHQGTLTR